MKPSLGSVLTANTDRDDSLEACILLVVTRRVALRRSLRRQGPLACSPELALQRAEGAAVGS
jgi:hypothetical protein